MYEIIIDGGWLCLKSLYTQSTFNFHVVQTLCTIWIFEHFNDNFVNFLFIDLKVYKKLLNI